MPRTTHRWPPEKPDKEDADKEITEFNAEKAAEAAHEAIEDAQEATEKAVELAQAVEDSDADEKARRCPVCKTRMHYHNNPTDTTKYRFYHCTTCLKCGPLSTFMSAARDGDWKI